MISKDMAYLRQQAQEHLRTHIEERMPAQYGKCLIGLNQVLKMGWDIANNDSTTPNSRLQALALINDSYRHLMELTTNGAIITDALKYVKGKTEKLSEVNRFSLTA
jgi:hypothetical protein